MPIVLPDTNILLALVDPVHPHHQKASEWFANAEPNGWVTCPMTENGFVRILSSPTYPGTNISTRDALALLDTTLSNHARNHRFWDDSISLRDMTLFKPEHFQGHKQVTDIYLLGLCPRNGGTLATLDKGISKVSIVSPHSELLQIL